MTAATARRYDPTPTQCLPDVHKWFANREQANAAALARSHHGAFYTCRPCTACTGWRLVRVS